MTLIRTRDLENLSAYLDGALNAHERSRLEAQLSSDPTLKTALEELRAVRAVLRQLPKRRAPRNFTLTPQQAGLRQPAPRAVPFLRLASALTGILFLFSLNTWLLPRFAFGAAAPAAEEAAAEPMLMQAAPADALPTAGDTSLAPSPTGTAPAPGMGGGIEEPPAAPPDLTRTGPVDEPAPKVPSRPLLPPGVWTSIALAVVSLASGLAALLLRRRSR